MQLTIQNAGITIEGKTILEYVNFDVKSGDHIAIVGRNGAGKTTLLKAIIDNSLFEEGIGEEKFSIIKYGKFNIGYLKQMAFEDESVTLLKEIRKSFQNLINMEDKLNNLIKQMEDNSDDNLIREYTEVLEQFNLLGGYSYQKEYEVMLNKFGFTEEDKKKKLSEFSGGQKTRISLMKLLLSKPDLLLLDEPTNHLDISTIQWLEEYLKKYKGAIIIVSHDRMFIDNIANIIYDIEYGKTTRYIGTYEKYEKEKRLNYEKAVEDYEYQQKEIKRLKAIYERFRFKPSKASLAMSRLHQLEKMDILEKPNKIDTRVFKTNLSEIERSGNNVLNIKNMTIGYDKPLGSINLDIIRGMKIGIIGKNGIGKSTLLKTLSGALSPYAGKVSYGMNLKIGYFDQTLASIESNRTILEEFQNHLPNLSPERCRSALGSFLFKGEDVFKKINVLSGGEKVRLQLCKIFYEKPNLLILDEPTNHLDIVGKEHLEDILKEYEGTLLFVSHDRYFIKKLAKELIVFDDDGITFYNYGYDEYIRKQKEKEAPEQSIAIKKETTHKKVTNNIAKDISKIEKEITKIEDQIKSLEELLYDPDIYMDKDKSSEITAKIDEAKILLEQKNNKWLELNELL